MGMSDIIAEFIDELLREENTAELQRSELASRFGCVPSQINYVISTRFSPERGYVVESRRGGGGYIRIHRVRLDPQMTMMNTVNAIGDSVDLRTAAALLSNAVASGGLDEKTAKVMLAGISDAAMKKVVPSGRDAVRASVLKHMILSILH